MSSRLIFAALIVISLAVATSANAQTRFSIGPQVGINSSWASYNADMHGSYQSYSMEVNHQTGYFAGLTTLLYRKHIALQSSLSIQTMGFQWLEDNTTQENGGTVSRSYNEKYRFTYLQIPFAINYFTKSNNNGFHVSLGGYGGLLLGGKIKHNNYFNVDNISFSHNTEGNITSSVQEQFSAENYYAKQFDVGLQGGIGYKYNSFLLQAYYQLGLLNVSNSSTIAVQPIIKHRSLGVGFSYFLLN